MSDNFISLVPEDPFFVPKREAVDAVLKLFKSIAPNAEEIVARQAKRPQLMDAGANLEKIICTECLTEQDFEWWVTAVEGDQAPDGFHLRPVAMPCCDANLNLNELAYHYEQAFGVFAIEAMNPNVGELSPSFIETAEAALNTPLTVVYCHL